MADPSKLTYAVATVPCTQPYGAMPYRPIPDDCFIRKLERYFFEGRHIWISDDRRFRFTWDSLHGEVEVYTRRGRHVGVMNCNRQLIGSAVKGRRIDV